MPNENERTSKDERTVESVHHRSITAVTQALKGIKFPVNKKTLIEYARNRNTPPETVTAMEQALPERGEYKGMDDVTHNFDASRVQNQ